jgi:hypothetical protein
MEEHGSNGSRAMAYVCAAGAAADDSNVRQLVARFFFPKPSRGSAPALRAPTSAGGCL